MGVICIIKNALKTLMVDPDGGSCINFHCIEFKVTSGTVINLKKVKSKTFYLEFLEYILKPPKALNKWRVEYGLSEGIFYEYTEHAKYNQRTEITLDLNVPIPIKYIQEVSQS